MKHLGFILLLVIFCRPAAGEDSVQTRLAAIAGTRVDSLELSPDAGSVLAIIRTRDAAYTDEFVDVGHRSLLHIDIPTGRTRRIASDCDDVRRALFSPDGTRFAHFAKCNGASGVAIRTFPEGSVQHWIGLQGEGLNPIGEVADLVWSDDGASLAVVHDPRVSWRERFLKRMTASVHELSSPIVVDSESSRTPLMSAQGFDGSFFVNSEKSLAVIDRHGMMQPLSWHPTGDVRLVRLTGRTLLVLEEGRLKAVALQGSDPPRGR